MIFLLGECMSNEVPQFELPTSSFVSFFPSFLPFLLFLITFFVPSFFLTQLPKNTALLNTFVQHKNHTHYNVDVAKITVLFFFSWNNPVKILSGNCG